MSSLKHLIDSLEQPIAVVCNDAGAANLLFSWLKSEDHISLKPLMQGPAEKLWGLAFPNKALCKSLDEVLDNDVKILISGTGWASPLEHRARQMARARGIYSIAVLDHWVNYVSRFERDGEVELPDEVWVSDAEARTLAHQSLPGLPVRQLENLYLAEQVSRIGPPPINGTVLVVLEPVRDTWGRAQAGEFQALDYLFAHLDWLLSSGVMKVLLRPHPSELADKYRSWLLCDPRVCIDTSPDVASAISQADVVVGLESSALIIALAAGRQVYSYLPPWAPPLRLPHTGIQQIRYMSLS